MLAACKEMADFFPNGVVYIDGIAVYLHAVNTPAAKDLAEFTHDADLYISLADMGDLRDLEEVTPNRRLSKHQLIKKGFEFDIYTERQSALIVPYDAVWASSVVYDGMRVASLEHLLVLKLEAYRDRRHSVKGDKDAKDLIRIATIADAMGKFRAHKISAYVRDDHLELLPVVHKSPVVVAMAGGNAVIAKKLRASFAKLQHAVDQAYRR